MNLSTTSPIIKSVHKAAVLAGALFLLGAVLLQPLLIPLPFMLLCVTAGKLRFASGCLLGFIWTLWLCFCFLPLFLYFGSPLCLLVVYSPALVLSKLPATPASPLFVLMLDILWDIPLLIWIKACSACSIRAIEPFLSPIVDNIYLGSLPLSEDVDFLASKGVKTVINMCREYPGPLDRYAQCGIKQYWFPTPDLSEPSTADIGNAIECMQKNTFEQPESAIFVHCKGGRGRAVSVVVCYLLQRGVPLAEAGAIIKKQRPIADVSTVTKYRVVQDFVSGTS